MNIGFELGIWLSVGCAALVGALVACEAIGSARGKWMTKPAASVMFMAVAIAVGALTTEYGVWIVVGLGLGVGGDVALLGPGKRQFLLGLSLFLAGHVAYVVAFARIAPPKTWLNPVAVVPIIVVAGILAWLWRYLGSYRPAVIAYVATIAVMLVAALASWSAGEGARRGLLGACGAVLFAASDVAVARDRFVASGVVNRAWGLPAYYAGQLLIAWSTAIM